MHQKPTKVFISHSSNDTMFTNPLFDLFTQIGLTPENLIYTSMEGYGIPLGENILDYLRRQFQDYNLLVIFILSDNYYASHNCLIEMGAAWVMQYKYTSILVPGFQFKDIKVVDPSQISIKLDSNKYELRTRLNDLRNILIDEFGLISSPALQNIWERRRDEFMEKVTSISAIWKQLQLLMDMHKPYNEWIPLLNKLNQIDPNNYDALYILGSVYAAEKDTEQAIKYLKTVVNFAKSVELKEKATVKLRKLGYMI